MIYRICALFFLWCTYVQINDPDPLLWMVAYFSNALFLELAARNLVYKNASLVIGCIGIWGAFVLFPESFVGFWGEMNDDTYVEEARESIGFLLIGISQFSIVYWSRSQNQE